MANVGQACSLFTRTNRVRVDSIRFLGGAFKCGINRACALDLIRSKPIRRRPAVVRTRSSLTLFMGAPRRAGPVAWTTDGATATRVHIGLQYTNS